MVSNKFSENLSEYQLGLNSKIFDLLIGRVLKRIFLNLDEAGKSDMEAVFLSDDDAKKEEFMGRHASDFKKFFEEEAKKIEEEIKLNIEKQF